jgi:hypothetical protein
VAAPATSSVPPAEVPAEISTTVAGTIGAVEPTGVPGLGSADAFCAAWAGYAGTLQALGIAASFGGLTSQRFAALELVAAPRLVDFGEAIGATWPQQPDALAAEKATVVEQRVGPHARRARKAVEALRAAGVTDAEIRALGEAWAGALGHRDPAAPVIDVPLDDALQKKVDVAAAAYDSAVTPYPNDPSLVIQGVQSPTTDAYLASHCPELAASGVGDSL